jgi:hypothetical protein
MSSYKLPFAFIVFFLCKTCVFADSGFDMEMLLDHVSADLISQLDKPENNQARKDAEKQIRELVDEKFRGSKQTITCTISTVLLKGEASQPLVYGNLGNRMVRAKGINFNPMFTVYVSALGQDVVKKLRVGRKITVTGTVSSVFVEGSIASTGASGGRSVRQMYPGTLRLTIKAETID